MEKFVEVAMYFALGCCFFALAALVVALIICMYRDIFR